MAHSAPRSDGLEPSLVLASGSPRRSDLLGRAGIRFRVEVAGIAEDAIPGETPEQLVQRLAEEKARAVAERLRDEIAEGPVFVLGADTVVVLGEDVLGKPDDAEHAVLLLQRLVGRTHRVCTGVALVPPGGAPARSLCVESRVTMRGAEIEELHAYVSTGEPLDKAGAYAFQGEGRRFIEHLEGSETNVIGLPMDETLALLRRAGIPT